MFLNNPYKGDFDHTPEVDRHGHFRDRFYYKGDFYNLPYSKIQKNKSILIFGGFFIFMILLLVFAGIINPDSSRTIYVVLPYLALLISVIWGVVGLVKYAFSPLRMNRIEFDKGIKRMKYAVYTSILFDIVSIYQTKVNHYEILEMQHRLTQDFSFVQT